MIKRLKPKSESSRNVLTLITGTTIAQAIPIAISPILTRLYTPEDFGVFALYMSIVAILSVFATGRYDLAIMLPEKDEDALHMVALSIVLTTGVSLIVLFVTTVFNHQITRLLGNAQISSWLYLIPLSVFLTGIYQSLNTWANRKKHYRLLSGNRIIQSAATGGTSITLGLGGIGIGGMIIGGFIGLLMTTSLLLKRFYQELTQFVPTIQYPKIFMLMRKHIHFPKYDIFATLSNVMAHQTAHILFNSIGNAATAGHYYLVQKILGLPGSVISSSVLYVFKEKAVYNFASYGNAKEIYAKTFKKLFLISFIPFGLLMVYAQDIFTLLFGTNWAEAGVYAQILAPMFFLQFIASPLSYILYITNSQRLNLHLQIVMFLLILVSFSVGYILQDTKLIVIMISFFTSCIYLFYILITYKQAKGNSR